jgi:hypothetical protein
MTASEDLGVTLERLPVVACSGQAGRRDGLFAAPWNGRQKYPTPEEPL